MNKVQHVKWCMKQTKLTSEISCPTDSLLAQLAEHYIDDWSRGCEFKPHWAQRQICLSWKTRSWSNEITAEHGPLLRGHSIIFSPWKINIMILNISKVNEMKESVLHILVWLILATVLQVKWKLLFHGDSLTIYKYIFNTIVDVPNRIFL